MSDDHTHEPPPVEVIRPDVHVVINVKDEFAGNVRMTILLSPADASKVMAMPPSVARLYFGHEAAPLLQNALREALDY